MNIGKSIFKLLSEASAVTAIVGTSPSRIYPNRISQKVEYPAIAYMQLTNIPTNQKDAVSGFDRVDYDIDCYSKDYLQLNTLAEAVRLAMDRKNISTYDTIKSILFVNEFEGYDDAAEVHQKTLQFRFIVQRTIT